MGDTFRRRPDGDFGPPPSKRLRGGGGGGSERRQQHRQDLANRLRAQIGRLGEQSKTSLEENITRVSDALLQEFSDFGDVIIDALVVCGANKPDRTSVYSTLIGLINARLYDAGKEIIHRLCKKLEHYLDIGNYVRAASLVRLLADLGNASVLYVPQSSSFLSVSECNLWCSRDNSVVGVNFQASSFRCGDAASICGCLLGRKRAARKGRCVPVDGYW